MLTTSVLLPAAAPLALALDLLLVVAVIVDWRRARALPLDAVHEWPEVLVQRHSTGDSQQPQSLSVTLRNPHETRSASLFLRETLHPALAVEPYETRLQVPAGHAQRFEVELAPSERGEHLSGPLTVRRLGPWKLCWSQRQLVDPEAIRVYPRIRWGGRVGQLLALAQRSELGAVTLDQRGLGGELYSLRPYQSGDARNRIHWKASARRGHLVTREDAWERGTPVVVLLDCGRAMSARADSLAKLDHSLAASLALTRLAAGRGDKVTIVAFSDRIERTVRVRPGQKGLASAYRQLYDLEPCARESLFDLATEHVLQMNLPRSTVLVMTSIVDLAIAELLLSSLEKLARRHRPLLINLEDPTIRQLAEEPPATVPEAYAKISSLEILLRNRQLTQQLRHQGTPAVTAPADQLALETLESYLDTLQRVPAMRA